MDPKQRNAAALRKRIDDLTSEFISQYRTIFALAKEDPDGDYSQAAHKELAIKEGAMAIVTTAQNMSMLIRDLQELWLFGSLDTLADKNELEGDREKALEVARLVEGLVKRVPDAYKVPGGEGSENGQT
ncbi:hypothetical protein N0V90_006108 [Kalmusia sp. IMI 367209]|nr:hypothetical protein N0V90_006108 [Kalmusia sp. IMI 367209]